MKTVRPDELPLAPKRMEMDVPPCPACGREQLAVREKVFRGDLEVTFWCCPLCGVGWRERRSQADSDAEVQLR